MGDNVISNKIKNKLLKIFGNDIVFDVSVFDI